MDIAFAATKRKMPWHKAKASFNQQTGRLGEPPCLIILSGTLCEKGGGEFSLATQYLH